jgi:hypothetical protein
MSLVKNSLIEGSIAALKATLSLTFPVGGPILSELISAAANVRTGQQLDDLKERLEKMEAEGRLKPEDIINNEQFNSVLIQTTLTAAKTHQKEKLEALRNAVLNTALGKNPGEAKTALFLSLVDRFTAAHLAALKRISDYDNDTRRNNPVGRSRGEGEITRLLEHLPEFENNLQLATTIANDLHQCSLIDYILHSRVRFVSHDESYVTELGREFLQFVSNSQ